MINQKIPNTPHMETENQSSIIFTERNEDTIDLEKFKIKQQQMEKYLK